MKAMAIILKTQTRTTKTSITKATTTKVRITSKVAILKNSDISSSTAAAATTMSRKYSSL